MKKNSGKMSLKRDWRRMLPFYVMMLPGLAYLIINNYLPMFGTVIAFKKLNFQKGIFGSDWAGFDNFKFLFASKDAWTIIRNTIGYNVVNIILGTVLALTMAILLNEIRNKYSKKIYQSLVLLPYLMSWVVVSYLCYAYLSSESGLANAVIRFFGGDGHQLVYGGEVLAVHPGVLQYLEGDRLQHDRILCSDCGAEPGLF